MEKKKREKKKEEKREEKKEKKREEKKEKTKEYSLKHFCQEKLAVLERAFLKRELKIREKEQLCFSSNDYLELSQEKSIIQAGIASALEYGAGTGSSRLITGTTSLILDLEKKIAAFKESESALFFNSGYATNLGVISGLIGKRDLVILDQFAHSSLIAGARLSTARVFFYPHNDFQALRKILSRERLNYSKVLLVSESLFSMDGDFTDLEELGEICEEFSTWLLIDEAHSTGIYGKEGKGLVLESSLKNKEYLIQVGTCSKAFGVQGGFVCGSKELVNFLIQRARTFIYSTAPSFFVVGALRKSLEIITGEELNTRREKLFNSISYFSRKATKLFSGQTRNISLRKNPQAEKKASQIFIFDLKSNQEALNLAEKLQTKKIKLQAIRKPTVPTPRLRVTLSSGHSQEQIDYLLKNLLEAS